VIRMETGYLVPRGDGRYVLGATVEERGFDPHVTAGAVHDLLRDAIELIPGVAELAIEETSVGYRPGTPDNAPILGPGAIPGLHWATGHYRHGVLLAPVTADLVVAALAGEPVPAEFLCRALRRGAGVNVLVNGESHRLPDGATVAALLQELDIAARRGVAVAVDAEVVPRSGWPERALADGARVEIVHRDPGRLTCSRSPIGPSNRTCCWGPAGSPRWRSSARPCAPAAPRSARSRCGASTPSKRGSILDALGGVPGSAQHRGLFHRARRDPHRAARARRVRDELGQARSDRR